MKVLITLLLLALAGCREQKPPKGAPDQARAERMERQISAGPTVKTYDIAESQLMVVTVPVKNVLMDDIEIQTCFVWRDKEFRSSSMQCEQPPEMDLSGLE